MNSILLVGMPGALLIVMGFISISAIFDFMNNRFRGMSTGWVWCVVGREQRIIK
jgi:hypothetical protein